MIGWREVVVSYPCEICGAGPGDRCRTPSGAVKWEPHASRSRLASANHWQAPVERPEPEPEG
jgi:hypothetical protein